MLTTLDQKSKKKKKPKKKGPNAQPATSDTPTTPVETGQLVDAPEPKSTPESDDSDPEDEITPNDNAAPSTGAVGPNVANGIPKPADDSGGATARFDALVKDRDALRLEVTQLRQSLEELQSKHAAEMEAVQGELADSQAEKESAEEQYQSLLGKVNTIRSQLGERLKADAVR